MSEQTDVQWLREYERRKLALIEEATRTGVFGKAPQQDAAERALDEWVTARTPYPAGGQEQTDVREPRELLCMICGKEHGSWHAPNELWNAVERLTHVVAVSAEMRRLLRQGAPAPEATDE